MCLTLALVSGMAIWWRAPRWWRLYQDLQCLQSAGGRFQPTGRKGEERDGVARTALNALTRRGVFSRREFQILSTVLEVLNKSLSAKEGEEVMIRILRALARRVLLDFSRVILRMLCFCFQG